MLTRNMPHIHNQRGASVPVVLMFIAMAAVILTVGFKLYPALFEQWQVASIVDSFSEEKVADQITVAEVKRRFQARLQTNGIRGFKFDENVEISIEDGILYIDVAYDSRVNVYKNIDALVVFSKSLEVKL